MLDVNQELQKIDGNWKVIDGKKLQREFSFKSFLKTMSFVNAIAWEANRLVHHPDLQVSFGSCTVNITTHDAGNTLTDKDFALARAIDALGA